MKKRRINPIKRAVRLERLTALSEDRHRRVSLEFELQTLYEELWKEWLSFCEKADIDPFEFATIERDDADPQYMEWFQKKSAEVVKKSQQYKKLCFRLKIQPRRFFTPSLKKG